MKRAIAIIAVLGILGLGAFFFWPRGVAGASDRTPFEKEYTLADSLAYFEDADTADSLLLSGQFYWGHAALPGGMGGEYDNARQAHINNLMVEATTLGEDIGPVIPKVEAVTNSLMKLMDAIRPHPKAPTEFMEAALKDILADRLKREASMEQYLTAILSPSRSPLARAQLDEVGFTAIVVMTCALMAELEHATAAGIILAEAAKAEGGELASAAAEMEAALAQVDQMKPQMQELADSLSLLDGGMNQLRVADLHYAKAALEYVGDKAPDLIAKADQLQPRGPVQAEEIEAAQKWLKATAEFSAELEKAVDQEIAAAPPIKSAYQYPPGAAYADMQESMDNAMVAIGNTLANGRDMVYGGLSAARTAVNAARKGTAYTLDVLGTGAAMWSQAGINLYEGHTNDDLYQDLQAHLRDLDQRWSQQEPPKDNTWRDARRLTNQFEQGAENLVGKSTAWAVGGEGWTSWGAGKIGRAVVGIFTGLGKGVAALADPSSSNGELAEGGLEILFASTGGGKIIFRTSHLKPVASGVAATAKEGVEAAALAAEKARMQALMAQVESSIAENGIARLEQNLIHHRALQEGLEAVAAARRELGERLAQRMADAASGLAQSAKSTAQQTTEDLFRTQFERSLGGVGNALLTGLGNTGVEGAESVVSEIIEDMVKDEVRQVLGDSVSPDELEGRMTATITVLDINLDANTVPDGQDDEGCLPEMGLSEAELKELIGRKIPGTIRFFPKDDRSGTLEIRTQTGGKESIKGEYTLGGTSLSAEVTFSGMTGQLYGDFTKENDKLKLKGQLQVDKGRARVELEITAEKDLPMPKTDG